MKNKFLIQDQVKIKTLKKIKTFYFFVFFSREKKLQMQQKNCKVCLYCSPVVTLLLSFSFLLLHETEK